MVVKENIGFGTVYGFIDNHSENEVPTTSDIM